MGPSRVLKPVLLVCLLTLATILLQYQASLPRGQVKQTASVQQQLRKTENIRLLSRTLGLDDSEIPSISTYYKRGGLRQVDVTCDPNITVAGKESWPVCMHSRYKPQTGSCILYSYSIVEDYRLESKIAETMDCRLRLFNREILEKVADDRISHLPLELNGFYGNHYRTMLESIETFNDEKNMIDSMRISPISASLLTSIFRTVFYNNSLRKVKQLILTVITSEKLTKNNAYLMRDEEIEWLLESLHKTGFRRFSVTKTDLRISTSSPWFVRDSKAYQLAFVNVNINYSASVAPGIESAKRWQDLDWQNFNDEQAEGQFEKYVMELDYRCESPMRIGGTLDGGWDTCLDSGFSFKPPCLVYSFGINWDWSFDDGISILYGCEVRSFDPSMQLDDSNRSDLIRFYKRGLYKDQRRTGQGWQMNTLKGFIHELNDSNRDIDYLKIDIEHSEWGTLKNLYKDNSLRNVKQLGLEIHTNEVLRLDTKADDYKVFYDLLKQLTDSGFKKWKVHKNQRGLYDSKVTGDRRTCCFEMYFINLKYQGFV